MFFGDWKDDLFTVAGFCRGGAIVSLFVHASTYFVLHTAPSLALIVFAALQAVENLFRIPEMFVMNRMSGKVQSVLFTVLYALLTVAFALPYWWYRTPRAAE